MTRTDIQSLSDTDHGRYRVNTYASTYEVDLDVRTIQRTSSRNVLRGDDQPVRLETIVRCHIGVSAIWVLSGLAEGVETTRTTTTVQSIEEAQ